jgi:SHS2 domain found in N terminus of Rpb7p/Rpc25p/MJ0397
MLGADSFEIVYCGPTQRPRISFPPNRQPLPARARQDVHPSKSPPLAQNPSHLTNPQTKIADLVQIEPKDFNKDSNMAIEDNINLKYSNKVIQKIGLCICMYDLLSASDGLIGHGTGLINVNGISPSPYLLFREI